MHDGGSWSDPTSYSPTVDMAEATEARPAPTTGVAGEPELASAEGTEYSTQGGEVLTENALSKKLHLHKLQKL